MAKPKQKIQQSRRKLLAALSVGVAAKLPEMWSKPTVASVLLPAHASGTNPEPTCSSELIIASFFYTAGSSTLGMVGRVVGLTGSPIYANFTFPGGTTVVNAESVDPGTFGATLIPEATIPGFICGSQATVNFYYPSEPSNILCSDSGPICSTVTATQILTLNEIIGP